MAQVVDEDNISVDLVPGVVTITILLPVDPPFTASGKSLSYASTEGWIQLPDGMALSLNLVGRRRKGGKRG